MADPISTEEKADAPATPSAAAQDTPKTDTTPNTTEPPKEAPKSDDGKAKDAPKEAPRPPEKYDLKLPEGSLLKPDALERIAAFAKERGLSNEHAQMVLESESAAVASHVEASKAGLKEQSVKWVDELKVDKDFGGEAFPKNAELAKRFIKQFGDESLMNALDETGLGNHPGLFKMVVRAALKMSPDTWVPGSTTPAIPKDHASVLYGDTSTQKE